MCFAKRKNYLEDLNDYKHQKLEFIETKNISLPKISYITRYHEYLQKYVYIKIQENNRLINVKYCLLSQINKIK